MRPGSPASRILVSSKQVALSSLRLQPGSFTVPGSFSSVRTNSRERRVPVSFGSANAPVVVQHNLGFVPSGYEVLGKNVAGVIYNDIPLPATSRVIVLKCNTANVVADILVR